MFSFFRTRVTDKIFDQFVNTGEVPDRILRMIAFKVIKREQMSNNEMAIFIGKTEDINKLIVEITMKSK